MEGIRDLTENVAASQLLGRPVLQRPDQRELDIGLICVEVLAARLHSLQIEAG